MGAFFKQNLKDTGIYRILKFLSLTEGKHIVTMLTFCMICSVKPVLKGLKAKIYKF